METVTGVPVSDTRAGFIREMTRWLKLFTYYHGLEANGSLQASLQPDSLQERLLDEAGLVHGHFTHAI